MFLQILYTSAVAAVAAFFLFSSCIEAYFTSPYFNYPPFYNYPKVYNYPVISTPEHNVQPDFQDDGTKQTLCTNYDKDKDKILAPNNGIIKFTEIFKTGGGAAVILPFTDYEKKLMNVEQLSVDGLPSEDDLDLILTGVIKSVTLAKLPETAIPAVEINNDNGRLGKKLL
ncbi:hypothetical protein RN001_006355 [Aquatica leii]|uniref:Uncharacterized protein n=1 Tax=Aquatica leii TaxID=1421715 RepID=A0AAN7SBD7_9COLE|nr:hypothetical protein RN001_006355 [Aquatica leii]